MISKNRCPVCGGKTWACCWIPDFPGDDDAPICANAEPVVDANEGLTDHGFIDFCVECETGVSSVMCRWLARPDAPLYHKVAR